MQDALMDAKVLRRAADLIEQGHCKHRAALGADGLGTSPVSEHAVAWCLTGALERAVAEAEGRMERMQPEDWHDHEGILQALRDTFKANKIKRAGGGVDWNNAPKRTADEVTDILRQAAERCENGAR